MTFASIDRTWIYGQRNAFAERWGKAFRPLSWSENAWPRKCFQQNRKRLSLLPIWLHLTDDVSDVDFKDLLFSNECWIALMDSRFGELSIDSANRLMCFRLELEFFCGKINAVMAYRMSSIESVAWNTKMTGNGVKPLFNRNSTVNR